jgi:hypothetical protein
VNKSSFRIIPPSKVDHGRLSNASDINNLTWHILAPGDIVPGVRLDDVLSFWKGGKNSDGNNVTSVLGVRGSEPNELVSCE